MNILLWLYKKQDMFVKHSCDAPGSDKLSCNEGKIIYVLHFDPRLPPQVM